MNWTYSAEYSWFKTVSQYDLGLLGPELGVTDSPLSSAIVEEVSMASQGGCGYAPLAASSTNWCPGTGCRGCKNGKLRTASESD